MASHLAAAIEARQLFPEITYPAASQPDAGTALGPGRGLPQRDAASLAHRCDPYFKDLGRLFP